MSEVQSRPYGSRGRGSFRGGRGGYRGARAGGKPLPKSDDQENVPLASPEDQGEVGELKKRFGSKVSALREVCGGWSDEDLVYALKETDGDVDIAFDRITNGSISQWGEVKKKPAKGKESSTSASEATAGARGGRGRGNFEGRGRGRSTERGRAGRGGRGGSQSNGTKTSDKATKPPSDGFGDSTATNTDTTDGWEHVEAPTDTEAAAIGDWENETSKDTTVPIAPEEPKNQPPAPVGKVKGWADLFAKPPPAPKKAPAPVSAHAPIPTAQAESAPSTTATDDLVPSEHVPPPIEEQVMDEGPTEFPQARNEVETPIILTPSKDELTESNLEQLPDVSNPPATATAASTVASTQDPLSSLENTKGALRPGMSGYAASALKATSGTGRSASFTRRVMEQHEAVVMPANHAVDRAAVQFGSMGLNGTPDDVDVDDEREEPETRTQLPDDSPAAPRASLPPALQEIQSSATHSTVPDGPAAQRQAPGLPPVQPQTQISSSPPSAPSYTDPYRYGQTAQKAYDPFGQQQQQQQQQPPGTQAQQAQTQPPEPFSGQVPSQTQQQASSLPADYSAYYGANARDYQNYYAAYGQGHDSQQRSGSAFGTSSQETQNQYATSRPNATYGQPESQNSGHNTPNPSIPTHQAQHSQHMPQHQAGHAGGYGYGYPNAYNQQYPQYGGYQMGHRYGANRPMFDDVRRQDSDYYNQYTYGHNQQQYGGSYNKSNMFGQPQHQYSYDQQSSTPANTAAYGQSSAAGREASYGRAGSAQPSETQQSTSNTAFGGMPDPFGRSHSGFGGQQQQSGSEDPAKAFEAAKASGPSPSVGQSHRPGSAVNSMTSQQQQAQSGAFPPPQSQHSGQAAFGGYPQYGGGVSNQSQTSHHQNTPYGGAYGSSAAAFGATYGAGYGSGRGWNNNYGGTGH